MKSDASSPARRHSKAKNVQGVRLLLEDPLKRDTLVLLQGAQYTAFQFAEALLLDSPTPILDSRVFFNARRLMTFS